MDTPVICIDGPGGSGKGTIARLVAEQLGWHFLDSGSLYRVLALAALNHGVALDNEQALKVMAAHLDVDFKTDAEGDVKVILEGEVVSKQLRLEETGEAASKVAVLPEVREALLSRQRAFARSPGLVADGRDMGTIVFPDAPVKIFLTASVEIRAERRHKQLKQQGKSVSIATLSKAIQERDERDMNREIAPLVPASDAFELDSTALNISQVLEKVMEIAKKALPDLAPIK